MWKGPMGINTFVRHCRFKVTLMPRNKQHLICIMDTWCYRSNLLPLKYARLWKHDIREMRWQIIEGGNLVIARMRGQGRRHPSLKPYKREIEIITQGLPVWQSRVSSSPHKPSSVTRVAHCTSQLPSGIQRRAQGAYELLKPHTHVPIFTVKLTWL